MILGTTTSTNIDPTSGCRGADVVEKVEPAQVDVQGQLPGRIRSSRLSLAISRMGS
jgi:hypothetical protein